MDTVDIETRSRIMSAIRGKDTQPEMLVRKGLFRAGFRYRLHDKKIAGKPDIVLRKYNALIFIHGCFWHGHSGCANFRLPKSRTEYWEHKINGNRKRDGDLLNRLRAEGWRICIVWECVLRGRKQTTKIDEVYRRLSDWLKSDSIWLELSSWDP